MHGYVYLLHFARPVGALDNPRGQASHYTGWAEDPERRNALHKAGQGAALTRAAVAQGVTWELFILCEGTRETERAIKNLKNARRICPICGQRHPAGRLHLPTAARQLELFDPFEAVPMPALQGPPDAYEWAHIQAERRARVVTPAPMPLCDNVGIVF